MEIDKKALARTVRELKSIGFYDDDEPILEESIDVKKENEILSEKEFKDLFQLVSKTYELYRFDIFIGNFGTNKYLTEQMVKYFEASIPSYDIAKFQKFIKDRIIKDNKPDIIKNNKPNYIVLGVLWVISLCFAGSFGFVLALLF